MDDKSEIGPTVSYKEYLSLSIEPLRQEMKMMRQAVEELSKGMVTQAEWQRMRETCRDHEQKLLALDERIDKLEHYHNVGMWVFRAGWGVAGAVIIATTIKFLLG